MKKNLTAGNRYFLTICIGLAGIAISILGTNLFIAPIRPGLDGSWQWAINYSFAKKLIYGIDFLFSYGPLGFVTHPLPIQNNILISYVFQFVATYIFTLILLFYIYTHKKLDIIKKILASLFVILLIAYINNLYL